MSLYARTAATLTVAASFIGLVGLAPQASASEPANAKHCAVVVERVKPQEKVSRVKSRTCSEAGTQAVSVSGRTLLVTWYEHAEYGGASTDIYGDYGPCDAAGYVLTADWWWRKSISSFITYNSCDGQQAVLNNGGAVYYYGFGTPYVGAQANDNIGWFKVWDSI
ncbi:hypothetical protein [Streptomyces sp. NPDC057280]|jgi:hypothetical protein|uniref:hypothetical protein n=1 Tax=Streptomyces sp. NPDC057280 TaxID=3346081 RepID=UPI00362D05B6